MRLTVPLCWLRTSESLPLPWRSRPTYQNDLYWFGAHVVLFSFSLTPSTMGLERPDMRYWMPDLAVTVAVGLNQNSIVKASPVFTLVCWQWCGSGVLKGAAVPVVMRVLRARVAFLALRRADPAARRCVRAREASA